MCNGLADSPAGGGDNRGFPLQAKIHNPSIPLVIAEQT
jgi:hypothetical protein